jgi:hypothetical protein
VRVLVPPERENGAFQGIAVERVKGDLRDRESVAAAMRGRTQVFHCAAMVSTFEGNAAHRHFTTRTSWERATSCGPPLVTAWRRSLSRGRSAPSASDPGYRATNQRLSTPSIGRFPRP